MRAGARSHFLKRKVILTGVAASVAHVGGDEAPLVCGRVVKLHRGEVARAVVPSDHVQQPVDGAHACSKESNLCSTNPPHAITSAQEKKTQSNQSGSEYGTCVPAAHVHVAHQPPAVGLRVENLHALPHQWPVMASGRVQQTSQHAHACAGNQQHRHLRALSL